MLTIALPKGRIFTLLVPLLEQVGIAQDSCFTDSRALVYPSLLPDWQLIIVRAYDVPAFVEHGGADIGITGKDVLMEHGGNNYYELLDLGISRCRLMTACKQHESIPTSGAVRVASKFPRVAKDYFRNKGQQAEIIKFHGAMEMAPIMGIADCIIDVVDTGKTLQHNGLHSVDTIAHISARLIVNKIRMKTHFATMSHLVQLFAQ